MSTSTENLVTLAELSTDMEAAMIIAALEREGIEAFMKGEFTAGFRAEAPSWPKVEVRESDCERARSILDSFEVEQNVTTEEEIDGREKPFTINWRFVCRTLVILYLIAASISFTYTLLQLIFGS